MGRRLAGAWLLATMLAVPGRADAVGPSLRPLERWFRAWRAGDISFFLGEAVSNGSFPVYLADAQLREVDRVLLEAAATNTPAGVDLLLDVASFHFDGSPEDEAKRADRFAAARPAFVRERATAALAAMKAAPARDRLAAEATAKPRGGRRGALRRAAAACALGLTGDPAALYPLRAALSDTDPEVRVAALLALESLAPDAVIALAAPALDDPKAEVRATAAEIHRRRSFALPTRGAGSDERDALAFRLAELLDDPSWWVRLSGVAGLAHLRSEHAVRPLLDLQRAETNRTIPQANLRVRDAAHAALVELTGVAIPLADLAGWDRWWKAAGPAFRVPPLPEDPEGGHRYAWSRFYGISLRHSRVLFVLDASGSMGSTVGVKGDFNSPSNFERVREELRAALGRLDPRASFGVILFSSEVRRWRDAMVPASEASVREAMAFVERRDAGGGTNLYGALREALRMREAGVPDPQCGADVDEIVLLSDGWPSVGEVASPEAIVRLVTSANRYARVRIHTVGLSSITAPGAYPFLEELAARNGGEHRVVSLR